MGFLFMAVGICTVGFFVGGPVGLAIGVLISVFLLGTMAG